MVGGQDFAVTEMNFFLKCSAGQALDLMVKFLGRFSVIKTSQSLGQIPFVYDDNEPIMTLTWGSQG